jgi:hypothetical protein
MSHWRKREERRRKSVPEMSTDFGCEFGPSWVAMAKDRTSWE